MIWVSYLQRQIYKNIKYEKPYILGRLKALIIFLTRHVIQSGENKPFCMLLRYIFLFSPTQAQF